MYYFKDSTKFYIYDYHPFSESTYLKIKKTANKSRYCDSIAQIHFNNKHFYAANKYAHYAIKLDSNISYSSYLIIYETSQKKDSSIWQKGFSLANKKDQIDFYLSRAQHLRQEKNKSYLNDLNMIREIDSTNHNIYLEQALFNYELSTKKDLDNILNLLNHTLKYDSYNAIALNKKLNITYQLKMKEEACDCYEKLVQLNLGDIKKSEWPYLMKKFKCITYNNSN